MSGPATLDTRKEPSGYRAVAHWLRGLAPLCTLLVLGVLFSIMSNSFLTLSNLSNLLVQIAVIGILAAGMTFVVLSGQIDLSIAAVMALVGMLSSQLFVDFHL